LVRNLLSLISTTQQRQNKNEKAKKGTPAVWTPVMVSHLFRDHQ
jgi:hypothetical protein